MRRARNGCRVPRRRRGLSRQGVLLAVCMAKKRAAVAWVDRTLKYYKSMKTRMGSI